MNNKAENKNGTILLIIGVLIVIFLMAKNTSLFSTISSQSLVNQDCLDTDNSDFSSKGGVYIPATKTTYLDECYPDGRVLEQMCMEGERIARLYTCPPNFACDDGACREIGQ